MVLVCVDNIVLDRLPRAVDVGIGVLGSLSPYSRFSLLSGLVCIVPEILTAAATCSGHMEFLRALLPFVFPSGPVLLSPMNADGKRPSSCHFSKISIAA